MFYSTQVKTPAEDAVAKTALEALHEVYPGHPWRVFVGGGVIQVKNLLFSNKWGMVRKLAKIQDDSAVFKRNIIMAAGEFLERARLKRAAFDGEKAVGVEGIPQKDFGR